MNPRTVGLEVETRSLQQEFLDGSFEARGFCSLCRRFVSRSFPRRLLVSDEEMSHIMDQENTYFEPVAHVHVFWIDRNFCVRRVEGIKIVDNGLRAPTWNLDGTIKHRQGSNVILLGESYVSSFTHIAGFLVKDKSTIIEVMPNRLENPLITKYSPEHDIAFSILPSSNSNMTNLSEWAKTFVKAIEESRSELDSDSTWIALSYGDANAARSPVSVDERILVTLLSSKHLRADLHPEIKSLIRSFSDELGVELDNIEQSFVFKNLYDEIEDMITRMGVSAAFRIFFKLFNSRMLKIEQFC